MVSRIRIKTKAERLAMDVVEMIRLNEQLQVEWTSRPPSDEAIFRMTHAAYRGSLT
jgi:hypothetical protein